MNKTDAMRHARTAVSIHGRGTSWTVIGPHDPRNLCGPSAAINASGYFQARSIAAGWKADVVLGLMGMLSQDRWHAMADARYGEGIVNTRRLVEIGLRVKAGG